MPKPTVTVRMEENIERTLQPVIRGLTTSSGEATSVDTHRGAQGVRSGGPHDVCSAMREALAYAETFVGATSPNPSVGCAILDHDGAMLACEAHRQAGSSHAEVLAIAACREHGHVERIHTLVVTLEPCSHHGRTPPCVDAILATPARRVVIGCPDPNPSVLGNGARRLAERGIDVSFVEDVDHPAAAALARASRRLIAPFATWVRTGRPWVTVKQALDVSGGMIPPAGRKTFTSASSLDLAHRLRRRADAILTGSGTVLSDAPDFTVRRLPDHPGKIRKLAILDRRRRTSAPYLEAARRRSLDPVLCDDLATALDHLGANNCLEVLIEAGPRVLDHVRSSALWHEWVTIRTHGDAERPDTVEVAEQAPLSSREPESDVRKP